MRRTMNELQWSLFDLDDNKAAHLADPSVRKVRGDRTLVPDAATEERFWSHVVRSRRCYFWTGAVSSPDGYGRITFRRNNRQRAMSAHRFALLLKYPELSAAGDDNSALESIGEHHCNEPLCVRVDPEHVQIGTQATNLAYAVMLGRHRGPIPTALQSRVSRSLAIRDYLTRGGDPERTSELFGAAEPLDQLHLF
ncbi:hypothetical protein BFL43_03060 [Williamsia sp. 1135]|nr:hypothetical protein BFL43_03060 [Williamsia sp. 1135]